MLKISCLVASILCAGSPLLAAESAAPVKTETAQPANTYRLGAEFVQQIRADYAAGSYSGFLKEMEKDYQDAKKENGLEGLIEILKEGARAQIHPEFATSYRIIQNEKNKALLDAVKGAEETSFAQKVRSAAADTAPVEETILSIYSKVPGSGKNNDENRLIDINLEYYYKAIHLDSISADERREKHAALEMDKMDKMVQASQSFEDKELKSAVANVAKSLDARLARNFDMSDLQALARGKVKAVSTVEEKTASIVSKAQDELADLHRHLLDLLDENGQTAQK